MEINKSSPHRSEVTRCCSLPASIAVS